MNSLIEAREKILHCLADINRTDDLSLNLKNFTDAANYWVHIADWMLSENERVDYQQIARLESENIVFMREEKNGDPSLTEEIKTDVLKSAEYIVRMAGQRVPSPFGYLGFLRIVKEKFDFLMHVECMRIAVESSDRIVFASEASSIDIGFPRVRYSCFNFIMDQSGEEPPQLEDLLFAFGDREFTDLAEGLNPQSESELEHWFERAALAFKLYGRVVLDNKPGAKEWLIEAQRSRDLDYIARLDALQIRSDG